MYQKKTVENVLVLILDLACMAVSLGIGFWIRYQRLFGISQNGEQQWLLYFVLLIYMAAGWFMDFYRHFFRRGLFEEFKQVLKAEAVVWLLVVSLLYVMHRAGDLSRLVLGYTLLIDTALMYVMRLLFKQIMLKGYRASRYSSRLLLVAEADSAEQVIANITRYNEWYRQIVGVVLPEDGPPDFVGEVPVVADMKGMMDYVIRNDVDEVFFTGSDIVRDPRLEDWIGELGQMGVLAYVNIDAFDLPYTGKKTLGRVGKYAVVTFARNLFSDRQLALKRTMDILGSLVGMVILGIVTLFVAPAIKLDSPGPVFFGQTRMGKNGRRFTCYKFRSMYVDAEERKKELMAQNEMKGLMFKMEEDPRITRVGRFLRRTSMDELPQFWNILRGEMSLVGTRPPTVDEFEHYEAKHKGRLSMTPGLTGLWQISGRSDIKDFEEVCRLDMEYIDNWSISKDIKILLATIKIVIKGRGSC